MPVTWTPEQVLGLAPDEASRKNASGLASARKWLRLSQFIPGNPSVPGLSQYIPGNQSTPGQSTNHPSNPTIIWGELQGSSADPYRCQIDLQGPEFKCSCPSRKLPCKHALGLFLLFANQPDAFEAAEPPDWVAAWLAKRSEQSSRKAAKADGRSASPDTDAQNRQDAKNRRAADRDRKIRAGLDDLETWLRDLLRQGLASAQSQPGSFWESTASRLVDAQASGLARLVRAIPGLVVSGDGWQERLLEQIARLYLAAEGYRRIDSLPSEHQADLRTVIGFTLKQEELAETPGVSDTWIVLGREIEEEAGLKTQRTWLLGQASERPALILSFSAAGAPLDTSLTTGTALPAELVFYPGACPLRAFVRNRQPAQGLPPRLPGDDRLVEATARYAAALASNPWLERYPLALSCVRPLNEDGEWALYDADNRRVLLSRVFLHGWTLVSFSGGQPISVFGEWNGERFHPLSAWTAEHFISFRPRFE